MSCCAWISSDRPTFPGAFGSGTRSSATRCTSRCPAAHVWARTSAALRRSPLRGSLPATIAHHVERSARQGDEAAIALLREAGEAAAPRAPASAARWFGAALRLLPPDCTRSTSGSSCCWPALKHSPPPGNSERATRHSSRA